MEEKIKFWWQKKREENIFEYQCKFHGEKIIFAAIEVVEDGCIMKCPVLGINRNVTDMDLNAVKIELEMEMIAEISELIRIAQTAVKAITCARKWRN